MGVSLGRGGGKQSQFGAAEHRIQEREYKMKKQTQFWAKTDISVFLEKDYKDSTALLLRGPVVGQAATLQIPLHSCS